MSTSWTQVLRKVDDYRWEIPTSYKPGMRVPGLVFADERMLRQIAEEPALDQVANVATLPGIVGASLAMPDIHWGYGFPVGGVAAFDTADGVISRGGGRSRVHRKRRRPPAGGSRRRESRGEEAGARPDRDPRVGQPLPGSAGRGRDLRRSSRGGDGSDRARPGRGLRALRLPRARAP